MTTRRRHLYASGAKAFRKAVQSGKLKQPWKPVSPKANPAFRAGWNQAYMRLLPGWGKTMPNESFGVRSRLRFGKYGQVESVNIDAAQSWLRRHPQKRAIDAYRPPARSWMADVFPLVKSGVLSTDSALSGGGTGLLAMRGAAQKLDLRNRGAGRNQGTFKRRKGSWRKGKGGRFVGSGG